MEELQQGACKRLIGRIHARAKARCGERAHTPTHLRTRRRSADLLLSIGHNAQAGSTKRSLLL